MSSPTRRARKRRVDLRDRAAPGPSGFVPMETVRNLSRHRLRSSLAIFGIVIGALALTTTGALVENFKALLDARVQYFGANVHVGPPARQAASLLPRTKIHASRKWPGAASAFPTYDLPATAG